MIAQPLKLKLKRNCFERIPDRQASSFLGMYSRGGDGHHIKLGLGQIVFFPRSSFVQPPPPPSYYDLIALSSFSERILLVSPAPAGLHYFGLHLFWYVCHRHRKLNALASVTSVT